MSGGVLHNSAAFFPPRPRFLLQLYLELLGGNGLLCLRDVRVVLEFDVGEPAFQHLLHLQNDIDVFAPERHNGRAEGEARETQKGRERAVASAADA